jgi:hypothetical protein
LRRLVEEVAPIANKQFALLNPSRAVIRTS